MCDAPIVVRGLRELERFFEQAHGSHEIVLLLGEPGTLADRSGLSAAITHREVKVMPALELALCLVDLTSDVRDQSEIQMAACLAAYVAQHFPEVKTFLEIGLWPARGRAEYRLEHPQVFSAAARIEGAMVALPRQRRFQPAAGFRQGSTGQPKTIQGTPPGAGPWRGRPPSDAHWKTLRKLPYACDSSSSVTAMPLPRNESCNVSASST